MNFSKLGTLFIALMIAGTTAISAQDLIARQAPIDIKLKSIDSLALKNQIQKEVELYSTENLYPSWNTDYVHAYGKVDMPESFRIDLRNFSMPTPSRKITSQFGYRPRFKRQHNGLDIKVNVGDTIYAAFDGKVRIVKYERAGYGKYIVLRHDNGLETIYGHLSHWLVGVNDEVRSGQPIGLGGNTGRSTGSHLHFETRFLGVAINPEFMFDFPNQDVTGDFYVFHGTPAKGVIEYEESSVMASADGSAPSVAAPQAVAAPSPLYHKVRKGDTLSKIAKEKGLTVDKICRLNGIKKTSMLKLGQVLRLS